MEELQGLLTANKAALDSANQLQLREKEQALAELAAQHEEEKSIEFTFFLVAWIVWCHC